MDYQQARDYLLSLPEAWEDFPFGPDVAVLKVGARMFATLALDAGSPRCNLKCDPQEALVLRDLFDGVTPGYHMNKKHWNTVALDADVPSAEIERMIDRSYGLVVKALPRRERDALIATHGKNAVFKP
ncbi:MAG: MmcQ/YjbR family DNA-binding protein [Halieaceae bacterium]|jgi:predicted DNA-binding protein (MmcQ/YjbR family)|nr:MmcQ/YjbR family DNA-binding protein [Halieaceae bacterium]